jgi:hypothetical protein
MIAKTNRRDFLGRSTLLPLLAASALSLECQPSPAAEPIKRVGGPRLKISLNAYSFSKALNDGISGNGQGMTLFELLDFCAKHDFDAIDPTGYFFPGYPKVPEDGYINNFKRRAFELGDRHQRHRCAQQLCLARQGQPRRRCKAC